MARRRPKPSPVFLVLLLVIVLVLAGLDAVPRSLPAASEQFEHDYDYEPEHD